MLKVSAHLSLRIDELIFNTTHSQGAGGQHVNNTESAVQLRFNVMTSSLPLPIQWRLLASLSDKVQKTGVIVIKAQEHRSQFRNRQAAVNRLCDLIRRCEFAPAQRIPTKPSAAAQRRILAQKTQRGTVKLLRRSPAVDD